MNEPLTKFAPFATYERGHGRQPYKAAGPHNGSLWSCQIECAANCANFVLADGDFKTKEQDKMADQLLINSAALMNEWKLVDMTPTRRWEEGRIENNNGKPFGQPPPPFCEKGLSYKSNYIHSFWTGPGD